MNHKRASRSKRARFAIFERDLFTCQYCGLRPPDTVLQLDHIHPISKGGEDTEENLITSCVDCNAGKTNRILGAIRPWPDADAQLLATQQEIVEARLYLEAKQEKDELFLQIAKEILKTWRTHIRVYYKEPNLPTLIDWLTDFGADEVDGAIRVAGRRDRKAWFTGSDGCIRYVIGILRTRREEASGE
jgi:HNH endonuclease